MNWEPVEPDELVKFKQYCNLVLKGPFTEKSEEEQTLFILLWIGSTGIDTYNSWTWAHKDDKVKPEKIWEKFEKQVAPKVNHRLARYQ